LLFYSIYLHFTFFANNYLFFVVVKNNAVQYRSYCDERQAGGHCGFRMSFHRCESFNLQNNRIHSSAAKKAQIPTSRLISEREHFSSTYDIA